MFDETPTVIEVKDHGHRVYTFRFLGKPDGPIYISDQVVASHLLSLLPWKLTKIGVAPWPPGCSIYRMVSDG